MQKGFSLVKAKILSFGKELSLLLIKALKTLVWHLSREPMKEIRSLKKNKQSVMYGEQVRANKAKD